MNEEEINELMDALHNMLAAFDTPIARRAIDNDFANEARAIAKETFEKLSKRGFGSCPNSSEPEDIQW